MTVPTSALRRLHNVDGARQAVDALGDGTRSSWTRTFAIRMSAAGWRR